MITTSAPKDFKRLIFSLLTLSGITKIARYPFTEATSASPIPVFPDVASTMVPPGFKSPFASASWTIATAIRSLTEPPGLKDSTFASTVAGHSAAT